MARTLRKHTVEQNVHELAIARLRNIFDQFDSVAVSFSGGKDSTVVLNLAAEVAAEYDALPLRVIFFDEEAISPDTEAYVRRVAARPDIALEWYCVPVVHRNGCSADSPHWYPWAPEDRERWVRDLPPEAITAIGDYTGAEREHRLSIPDLSGATLPPERYGRAALVMGVRADESMARRRVVSSKATENYLTLSASATAAGNVMHAYPIYDWRTADVWTAPAMFGWDYNRTYDLYEMAGISHHMQRIAPPYGEQPMKSLWTWQVCYPDLWDRMVDRVPGAATAARYATTELYAAGAKEDLRPLEGESWQDAIARALASHEPDTARHIARRIRAEIAKHHKKAENDPILEATHPWTGVSWGYLYRLAVRGDLKERERPEMQLPPITDKPGREKYKRAYDAERERRGL